MHYVFGLSETNQTLLKNIAITVKETCTKWISLKNKEKKLSCETAFHESFIFSL